MAAKRPRPVGRKFKFAVASSDAASLIEHPGVNAVVIATQHDSHASLVCGAIATGKHVFVEKPLALSVAEIDAIESAWRAIPEADRPIVMVGFNRRFAPLTIRLKQTLSGSRSPITMVMTVNAGALPPDHWTHDPDVGGGRLIGEACHFVDLMRFIVDAPIESWQVATVRGSGSVDDDKATITLRFGDGSIGTIHYFANGHGSFPKERLEVFSSGGILQIDNFRRLRGYGLKGYKSFPNFKQDKGQEACARAFLDAIEAGKQSPIGFDELIEVSRTIVNVGEAARS